MLSWILNFIGLAIYGAFEGIVILSTDFLSKLFLYFANWPSIYLLKISPYILLYPLNPLRIIFNSIGWGVIGFIVGFTISIIKLKKQDYFLKQEKKLSTMNKIQKVFFYIAFTLWILSVLWMTILGFIVSMMPYIETRSHPNEPYTPGIFEEFFDKFSSLITYVITPSMITTAFIIAVVIIILNIKLKFLNLWKLIILWCIIASFLIPALFINYAELLELCKDVILQLNAM
jgi:hypothetical protein